MIASVAGIFAAITDIMFVDIPFQAEFDESLLQKLLENIWHSSLKDLVLHLEEKAKVPYDISIHESGLRPDNHRLKSLSHDPLFGLFFSFFDFVFATTTYIDKHGDLSILKNESKSYKPIALYQSVYYFIAHILSDMFTARGIPLPGFFITQIFSEEKFDSQIAQRAEKAYIEGYDFRHLPWMALPNKIQELILKTYQTLEEDMTTKSIASQASKELLERERAIRFIKMDFLATSIHISANLGKYILSFDPKAINLVTWYHFIGQSILYYQVENRDKEIEDISSQRQEINKNWEQLL